MFKNLIWYVEVMAKKLSRCNAAGFDDLLFWPDEFWKTTEIENLNCQNEEVVTSGELLAT